MVDLLALLRTALGNPTAQFREGQEEAIRAALEPPFRSLVVQATGWGKSMVYFIATKVLRDQGRGPTLVVSPLLSLMRDQLRAASLLGLKAEQFTSENNEDWTRIKDLLARNEVDLLLISPERLANEEFRLLVASSSLAQAGLIVIDEAHCISDWGHDFRPDYQRLGAFIRSLPPTTSVLATTATANNRVVNDILNQIGPEMRCLRGSLARKSLKLQVVGGLDMAERLAWLGEHLDKLPGSGIIYVLTQLDSERVAAWLQTRGHNVQPYHAGIKGNAGTDLTRPQREELLLNNKLKALVATVALGMGFDKPDLGFVVHYQSPGNLVAYYQQIGRAGRAIEEAFAILFLGGEDDDIHTWFMKTARPSEEAVLTVLNALESGPASTVDLDRQLNIRHKDIESVLKCLSILSPAPIVRVGTQYQRTPVAYQFDAQHETELRARREEERARFLQYAQTNRCFMQYVREELDDLSNEPCGQCANCTGKDLLPRGVSDETIQAAMEFLNRSVLPIQPRKRWPNGGLPEYGFRGVIGLDRICAPGICLSHWGDPGIGKMVREDKPKGHFRDELVQFASDAIRRKNLGEFLGVAFVPSTRSGNLVKSFAERLARILGVPILEVVRKVRDTEPQKDQQNGAHQALNLDGAFMVEDSLSGRILLVDDMIDSGWTLTIIGALLRKSGASEVVPFALARTSRGDDSA